MIERWCEKMLAELEQHNDKDKEEIFLACVNERLNNSFTSYQHELNQGLDYLKRRNELNVIRKLNRMR